MGLGICGLLFQGEGVCLKARNSREVQDENENSRGGLLDGGATFISYNWPRRCAFSPFFLLCPTPTVPFRLLRSRLLKKRRESARNCGSKGGLLQSSARSLLAPHSLARSVFLLTNDWVRVCCIACSSPQDPHYTELACGTA